MEVSKGDLEALAEARIREAKSLYQARLHSGAYYLAGYAVELAIKACIAKHIRSGFIPDRNFVNRIYQHKFDDLIGLAGLKDALNKDIKGNPQLGGNWGIACGCSEESRYSAWDEINAAALISAIAEWLIPLSQGDLNMVICHG
jgi:hypothetical protein